MASEACKKGHVRINGKTVKPSREVYKLDEIIVRKNQINYELSVLDVPSSRVSAKLVDIYRKDTTPKEVFQNHELMQLNKNHTRQKGEGRPTKKERRDIDDYLDESE
jgi:ribosome-associated heat shock protein Hsp15